MNIDIFLRFITPDNYQIIKYEDRLHVYSMDSDKGMSDSFFKKYISFIEDKFGDIYIEYFHQIRENNESFSIYIK